jgi:hypothetical protein
MQFEFKGMYRNTKVRIKFNDGICEPIHINKGVRQGVVFHRYNLIYTLIKFYRNLKYGLRRVYTK